MTTFCEECEHMHPDSRKAPSSRAMCIKFPRMSGAGFVSLDKWDKDAPYMLCRDINGGNCPLFETRRDGQMQLQETGNDT